MSLLYLQITALSALAVGSAILATSIYCYDQDVRISNGPRTVSFPEFRRHVFYGSDPFSKQEQAREQHLPTSGLEAAASPVIAGEYALYLVGRGLRTLENRITGR